MATTTIKATPVWKEGNVPTEVGTGYVSFPSGDWTEINIFIKAGEGYANASYYFTKNVIESITSNTRFPIRGFDDMLVELMITSGHKWGVARIFKGDGTATTYTAKLFYR